MYIDFSQKVANGTHCFIAHFVTQQYFSEIFYINRERASIVLFYRCIQFHCMSAPQLIHQWVTYTTDKYFNWLSFPTNKQWCNKYS